MKTWLLSVVSALATTASAQCWLPPTVNYAGPGGPNARVFSIIPYDSDGAGPATPVTLASGDFNQAGLVPTVNIAMWDGQQWSASPLPPLELRDGFRLRQTSDGRLFATGYDPDFVHALVDGAWVNMSANLVDGPESIVNTALDIVSLNGELYVGGYLRAGDQNCIAARWTGTAWEPVGQPWTWPSDYRSMKAIGGSLYVFGGLRVAPFADSVPMLRLNSSNQWVEALADLTSGTIRSVTDDGDGVLITGSMTRTVNGIARNERVARFSPSGFESLLNQFSSLLYSSAARVNGEVIVSTDTVSGQRRGSLNRIVNNTAVPISTQRYVSPPFFYTTTHQGTFLTGGDPNLPGMPGTVALLVDSRIVPVVEGYSGRVSDIINWNNQTIVLGEFLNSHGQLLAGPGVREGGIIRPLVPNLNISVPTSLGTIWNDKLVFGADAVYSWDGTSLTNLGMPAPANPIRQMISWDGQLFALTSYARQQMPGASDMYVFTDEGWLAWNTSEPLSKTGRLFVTSTDLFTASYTPPTLQQGPPAKWNGSRWVPLDAAESSTRLVGTWHDAAVGLQLVDGIQTTRLWRNGFWQNHPSPLSTYYSLTDTDWDGDATFGSELVITWLSTDGTRLASLFNGTNWSYMIRPREDQNLSAITGATREGLSFSNVINVEIPRASIYQEPQPQTVHVGQTVTFRIDTDADAQVQWRTQFFGQALIEGPQPDGSFFVGTNTPVLTIRNVTPITATSYYADVTVLRDFAPCSRFAGTTAQLTILPAACDSADFNNNGLFPEDQDITDFFTVLAGGPCSPGNTCNDIDFNNNQVFPEDQDVIDFFNVLAGGICQ